MLPTTGRFKNFNCPFYDTCICERPYCHFKHTKKEAVNDTNLISELVSKAVHKVLNSNLSTKSDAIQDKQDESTVPVVTATTTSVTYNPTPIAQLNKIKSTTTTTTTASTAAAIIEKKNRHIPIQYTPEQPRSSRSAPKLEYTITDYTSNINAGYSPAVNNYSSSVSYVPSSIKTLTSNYNKNEPGSSDAEQKGQIYVPSNVNSNESYTNLGSPSTTVKYSPTRNLGVVDNIDNEYVPKYNDEFIDDFLNDPNIYEPTEISSKKGEKSDKNKEANSATKLSSSSSTTTKSDDKSTKKPSSSKSSSSSSSSRSKSKESDSKSKHSNRDKHKSKESDQKNGCDKKHKSISDKHKHSKSSSDSHKSSSDSHKSRDRDKHRSSSDSKSKSKEKEKHSEKDKSNDKVKSSEKSKSSSKSVSNDKDKVSKDKHKSKTKQPVEDVPPVSDDMDYDDYPDDISDYESDEMEQCKRIFEEYQAPAETPQPEIKVPAKSSNSDSTTISKKRVAHDKSTTVHREKPTKAPPVKNAALVMTNRYKIIQAQIEQQNRENENKAAQAFAAKQLKQGMKRSIEYQQQVANIFEEKTQDNQYQAISSSKIKRIAHVPNVSSLLNAKKKMEEKSTKESANSKTPTQTISKGSKRVAHTPELSFADIPTVLQSERSKLPVNVRSRYLFLMTKECVKLYVSKQAAYDRALNEELNCYSKCSTINTYKNSIMLSINRVRKEAEAGISMNGSSSHLDNTSEFEGKKLYNNLLRWTLSEDELIENGFPRTGAAKKGHAVFKINKTIERIPEQCQLCVRCKKIYRVDEFGFPVFQEDCIYHPLNRFVFRGETRYICCKQPPSSDGCCICNSHVFEIRDPSELTGFVSTFEPEDENDPRNYKVYALDCEMVYTTRGSELARVTVIDSKCDVVYESLVKPLGYILDYNTRFSGLTLEMLENVTKKITEVQATLLLIFNSKTILVGHSLESDLKALRIIHDTVVDTSVLFPHKMGPPRKRALRNLASDYLKKIIQNDESGHDSAEDAITCMELLVWKLKEELKTR